MILTLNLSSSKTSMPFLKLSISVFCVIVISALNVEGQNVYARPRVSPTPFEKPIVRTVPVEKPIVKPTPAVRDDFEVVEQSTEDVTVTLPSPSGNELCETSDSPIIQGLRLGTTLNSVKKDSGLLFSAARPTPVAFGGSLYFFASPRTNVYFMGLVFYDSKLGAISVVYDQEIDWQSLREFKNYVAKGLNLPAMWTADDPRRVTTYTLDCTNYILSVHKDNTGRMNLSLKSKGVIKNAVDKARLEQKRKELEKQRKKETFKP